MDLNTLISQFFTDEEVKRAFTSICGTVEDGDSSITKYSVIDEFAEPLQRICDFINELQNHINNLIATRNNPIIATIDVCDRDITVKHSTPSNLDDAATDYSKEVLFRDWDDPDGNIVCFDDIKYEAFKAGAEWQKAQILNWANDKEAIDELNKRIAAKDKWAEGYLVAMDDLIKDIKNQLI